MDENGDGVLDRTEIDHCLRNLGFPFEEVSDFFLLRFTIASATWNYHSRRFLIVRSFNFQQQTFQLSGSFLKGYVGRAMYHALKHLHQSTSAKELTECLQNPGRARRLYEAGRRQQ
jgi:hypothetical protein